MKRSEPASEITLDFLVPAKLASRYRARLSAVSPREAEIRLPFRPAMFKGGGPLARPAQMTLVLKALVVQVRGTFEASADERSATGRLRFEAPIPLRDFEILRGACELDRPAPEASRAAATARAGGNGHANGNRAAHDVEDAEAEAPRPHA